MKQSYNGKHDYHFGQSMQALRTSIGLTQMELARRLGISRRAVGDWERGFSYPKAEHLKQLIELGVEQQAFSTGQEIEEIQVLWNASHQKVLLDQQWLSTLFCLPPSPSLPFLLPPVQETRQPERPVAQTAPGTRVDWGEALAIPTFYGRKEELVLLTQWVVRERCRVVGVLGMGGIGKTALAVNLMHQVVEHFEVVIFRSLRNAPPCEVLLDDLLQAFAPESLRSVPENLERRISLLLTSLQTVRALVVLDNLEALLEEGTLTGRFRVGFEAYERLLLRLAEIAHQSCLLLTSREKPATLRLQEDRGYPVHLLRLGALDPAACELLLAEKAIVGSPQEQVHLTQLYSGNPLALRVVAQTILELFKGEIAPFLQLKAVVFGSVRELLAEHYARLSSVEQTVLLWLAILREPVTLEELHGVLAAPTSGRKVFEAIDHLRRRSLIERGQRQGSFTLQSVVLEYVTTVLIEETTREVQQGKLDHLIQHGLEQAYAREYVRQTQERLLLVPILVGLQNIYQGRNEVEELLLSLLNQLRERADYAQNYGPANLIALLRLHRGHLRDLDISHLVIRGAYLQGTEMQNSSLARALIRDTAFTEALDAIWSLATSLKGTLWAAGSRRGEVRVWDKSGQTLRLICQAHTDVVSTLAFSPDGCTLASGSWDGTVKLWNLESGALLWTGRHKNTISLAFSPDGSMLASGGRDATVQLWDPQRGTNLQILPHPGSVYKVTWSPDGGLLASGDFKGCIRLWRIQKTAPATCAQKIEGHTDWAHCLAFAPDGSTLVSGSWDHTVKLWEVTTGRLLQTLSGHTDKVHCVAWSPDGRTVASCSLDKTIWLWDVEQGNYRAVLHGHTAAVYSIVFTPDNRSLLSSSEDGTLRIWDVAKGQCERVMQGYAVCFYDIDWSPDSTHLVSGGTDTLVTIWNVTGGTRPRVLRGHNWIIYGIAWSPDGRWLASSEMHTALRLWDATSGACVQQLRDLAAPPLGVAWSPDGQRLACGTDQHGIQVWDRTKRSFLWGKRPHPSMIRHVAWSPDGTQVVGGGDDGNVYLWRAADGTLRQRLPGHHGIAACVVWSPDGTRLASCGGSSSGGELLVWNVQSGECMQTLAGHPSIIYAVAWGSTGDLLVSGGSDGILRWWDVQSGECLRGQKAHQGAIQSLKRSPNGQLLASCGDDGAIMIWDLDCGKHLQTLRRDRPYERLNITGIRGIAEAQKATLRALGAFEIDVDSD